MAQDEVLRSAPMTHLKETAHPYQSTGWAAGWAAVVGKGGKKRHVRERQERQVAE